MLLRSSWASACAPWNCLPSSSQLRLDSGDLLSYGAWTRPRCSDSLTARDAVDLLGDLLERPHCDVRHDDRRHHRHQQSQERHPSPGPASGSITCSRNRTDDTIIRIEKISRSSTPSCRTIS